MNFSAATKVTKEHLKKNAYLYIRQSTLKQVFENTESTKRQSRMSSINASMIFINNTNSMCKEPSMKQILHAKDICL